MRLLVTAPSSAIGFTTVKRLAAAGHQLRCFETASDSKFPDGFQPKVHRFLRSKGLDLDWVWGDIRDPDAVRSAVGDDIDAVIHLAAMTFPTQCEEQWRLCWEVNYGGTRNVVDAVAVSRCVPKLIFASSVAVYGPEVNEKDAFVETDPLPATCTYAATKIASELYIAQSAINYTIMRIATVIDSGGPQMAATTGAAFAERMAKENRLKSSTNRAHLLSSVDFNTAVLNALENPESDRRAFTLAGPADCRTTFRETMDALRSKWGMPASTDDAWGPGPYPQSYYNTTESDRVLEYSHTGREQILSNIDDSVAEAAEFMSFTHVDH